MHRLKRVCLSYLHCLAWPELGLSSPRGRGNAALAPALRLVAAPPSTLWSFCDMARLKASLYMSLAPAIPDSRSCEYSYFRLQSFSL